MNVKELKSKSLFLLLLLVLLCLSVYLFSDSSIHVMQSKSSSKDSGNIKKTGSSNTGSSMDKKEKLTIVVDAGHGGRDPGKVGINGALEKDINLSIALKLKSLLEQNDINVIMLREDDSGLYSEGDSNKKVADMRKRVDTINSSKAVLAISIHQNSFTQESIKGAQVFYFNRSVKSKTFAEIMQNQLKKSLADGNKRVAKSNDSYYMLKKTECPIIIVECGYLSNTTEAGLLLDGDYQEKMAWAIHLGIFNYLNQPDDK
jgi:N-acetylmuramoyl-L-alanine amidase